jgi:cystathionine beta-lyase/cystathionine gamma-synthase
LGKSNCVSIGFCVISNGFFFSTFLFFRKQHRNAIELSIAKLENCEKALAFASGMAASSAAFFTLLARGDHVVAGNCLYSGNTELLDGMLQQFGVETTFVDASDVANVAAALRDNTKLIYVETPANPTLAISDLIGIAKLAKEKKIFSLVDNTSGRGGGWLSFYELR